MHVPYELNGGILGVERQVRACESVLYKELMFFSLVIQQSPICNHDEAMMRCYLYVTMRS